MSDEDIAPDLPWVEISRLCDLRVRDRLPPNALLVLLGIERSSTTNHLRTARVEEVMFAKAEREVATMLAHGFSRQEIADERFVALSTVMTQLKSCSRKLNARSQTHMVYLATKRGLIA